MRTSEYVFGPPTSASPATYANSAIHATLHVRDALPPVELVDVAAGETQLAAELADPGKITWLTLIDLILKNPKRLSRVLRANNAAGVLLPKLLAISLVGFVLYGATMSLTITSTGSWPELKSISEWLMKPDARLIDFQSVGDGAWDRVRLWYDGRAGALIVAYAFGIVATAGVCLPSLYFYGLLAGIRMSMLDVVVHSVKAKAVAAVALIGILPIYVAVAMATVIFGTNEHLVYATMLWGLVLPFAAGLWGTFSLYEGLSQFCDTLPASRLDKRQCFLRRLVFSWSACYTAVMPVMIYSLWQVLTPGS